LSYTCEAVINDSDQLTVNYFLTKSKDGTGMTVEIRRGGPLGYYYVNYCFFNYVEEKVEEEER